MLRAVCSVLCMQSPFSSSASWLLLPFLRAAQLVSDGQVSHGKVSAPYITRLLPPTFCSHSLFPPSLPCLCHLSSGSAEGAVLSLSPCRCICGSRPHGPQRAGQRPERPGEARRREPSGDEQEAPEHAGGAAHEEYALAQGECGLQAYPLVRLATCLPCHTARSSASAQTLPPLSLTMPPSIPPHPHQLTYSPLCLSLVPLSMHPPVHLSAHTFTQLTHQPTLLAHLIICPVSFHPFPDIPLSLSYLLISRPFSYLLLPSDLPVHLLSSTHPPDCSFACPFAYHGSPHASTHTSACPSYHPKYFPHVWGSQKGCRPRPCL